MAIGATLAAYIVAGVFFILTLRGLSNPETSRQGNTLGMIGMTIAIITTLLSPEVKSYIWIVGGIVLGGAIVVAGVAMMVTARSRTIKAGGTAH